MIISLNEWKKKQTLIAIAVCEFKNKQINEIAVSNSDDINFPADKTINSVVSKQCLDIAMYAKDFDMSKPDTIGMVQKIFVDPTQAPDDISVAFVQNNMGEIVEILDNIPDDEYPENPLTFTTDMTENEFPFECVMYVKENLKIEKLTKILNTQITKNDFKSLYENNIFFINSIDKLNDKNRNTIMKLLQQCNAKNISTQLKWKRKL
jgi:hypothetical protein